MCIFNWCLRIFLSSYKWVREDRFYSNLFSHATQVIIVGRTIIKIAIILIFMRTLVVTADACEKETRFLFFICHAIKINKCLWLSQNKKRINQERKKKLVCAPVVMSNKLKQINQATLMSDHLLIKNSLRSFFRVIIYKSTSSASMRQIFVFNKKKREKVNLHSECINWFSFFFSFNQVILVCNTRSRRKRKDRLSARKRERHFE